MNNDPVLFVNSIFNCVDGVENQDYFDSRKMKKNEHVMHRINDCQAFLSINKRVFVTAATLKGLTIGEIVKVKDNEITINSSGTDVFLLINEIIDLKITSVI